MFSEKGVKSYGAIWSYSLRPFSSLFKATPDARNRHEFLVKLYLLHFLQDIFKCTSHVRQPTLRKKRQISYAVILGTVVYRFHDLIPTVMKPIITFLNNFEAY